MNPTLLQHQSFDLPLASDVKYLGQERSYSNLAGYSVNNQPCLQRRGPNGLTSSNPSSSLVVPTNPGLEFHTQPSFTDAPYHTTSQLLLSPPDSTGGSNSAIGVPISSPFAHATLPKPYPSNASASEHFAGVPGAALPSTWRDPTMTGVDRSGLSLFPPSLSPPQSFSTAPGMNGYHPRQVMERTPANYHPTMVPSFVHQRTPHLPFSNGLYSQRFPQPDASYHVGMQMPPHGPERQEGPPFGETHVIHAPLTGNAVDGKWTCYRRNYFTVSCSFNFGKEIADTHLYLKHGQDKHMEHIQHFAVSISAKTAAVNNLESEARGLVQHTPKRNKESETIPTKHAVVPATQTVHHHSGAMSLGGSVYTGPQTHPGYPFSTYSDPPAHSAPSSYTFERIQFQKATANNGKRRAQQQYFHVVVELHACLARNHREEWVLIATKESDPMVVRGRSPGHYKDNNRRDSQTSMDPDRGTGPGSDGSSNGQNYGSYGSGGGIDWRSTGSHHAGNHGQYGDPGYRHCMQSDESPPSATSSTTLTGSPNDLAIALSDVDPLKSSEMYSLDRSRFTTSPSEAVDDDDEFFSLGLASLNRKRPFEEDSGDEDSSFACSQPFPDSITSNTFGLPSMTQSKLLCAS